MTRTGLFVLCAALLIAVAVGCHQQYTVTFVNMTPEDLTVSMEGPGEIDPSPASLPLARRGGRAVFKVAVDDDELPASYAWHADSHQGSVVVHQDSKPSQIVNIRDQ